MFSCHCVMALGDRSDHFLLRCESENNEAKGESKEELERKAIDCHHCGVLLASGEVQM